MTRILKPPLLLLMSILVLAMLLRTLWLGSIPAGFFCDEAAIGYNAYSLLHTGRDEYGVAHPLFFASFGEYKNPVATYSTIPFIWLFGLTEAATRAQAVLYGVAGVLALYFLTKTLCHTHPKAVPLALLSAGFLSISPWHIHFSRVSLEGLTAFVCFTILAVWLFLKGFRQPLFLLLSALCFCLAMYSYFPARVFIPVFGTTLFCCYFTDVFQHKKELTLSILCGILLLLPLLLFSLHGEGMARFEQVSIFSHPPTNETVLSHIVSNYLSHFSLNFLFFTGDSGMPGQFITRHSVSGMGELYLFQLPLILLGLWFFFCFDKRAFALLCFWLVYYPLGSMFTLDTSVQATRSIIGVVPFQILSAGGLIFLIDLFTHTPILKKVALSLTAGTIICSCAYYCFLYFVTYPTSSSGYYGWQAGYRQIVTLFAAHQHDYDDLLVTHRFNRGEELLKFYTVSHPCSSCQVMTNPITVDPTRRQLFALREEDILEAKARYPQLTFIPNPRLKLPAHIPDLVIGSFTP